MYPNVPSLLRAAQTTPIVSRSFDCWTAAITKRHRRVYERDYPVTLILPDGSSLSIRYFEPRKIIHLPLDLSTLSEAEKKARIENRRPKTKISLESEEENVEFDAFKYIKRKVR
ncbi:39S ribosomal protein L55, mitochondrial isoform X2 [Orussus abietinus]|nr:39S ribosomal protein L55, mitochondrial isoform X2 [Orussus abietinus]